MPRRSASNTASASSPVSPIADPGPLEEEQQPAPASAAPRKRTASRKGKGAEVNVEALTEITRLGVGALSYVLALIVAAPDMGLASDLSMTEQETPRIADPAARIISRTSVAKRYANLINNGNDWAQLGGGVLDYGERFLTVYFERRPIRARTRQVSQQTQPASIPVAGTPAAGSNGHQPTYDGIPAHMLAQ